MARTSRRSRCIKVGTVQWRKSSECIVFEIGVTMERLRVLMDEASALLLLMKGATIPIGPKCAYWSGPGSVRKIPDSKPKPKRSKRRRSA